MRLFSILLLLTLAACAGSRRHWEWASATPPPVSVDVAMTICKGRAAGSPAAAPIAPANTGNSVSDAGIDLQNIAVSGMAAQQIVEGCMAEHGYVLR